MEYNYLDYNEEISKIKYDPKEKRYNTQNENYYKIDDISNAFVYENLPKTVPSFILERFLLTNGNCIFTQHDNNYYVFCGGAGGVPDVYHQPTIYTVANSALKLSKQYKIDEDCVLIRNDSSMQGIIHLINKYNSILSEIDLTIYRAIVAYRCQAFSTADNPKTALAINKFYEKLELGDISCVLDKSFSDNSSGITMQPLSNSSSQGYISSLIELRQYISSTLNNRLGINCNFNMKREALSTAECTLNDQSVVPLIIDMFKQRLIAVEKINKMYGLNIIVKLNNLWAENVQSTEPEEDNQEDSKEYTQDDEEKEVVNE